MLDFDAAKVSLYDNSPGFEFFFTSAAVAPSSRLRSDVDGEGPIFHWLIVTVKKDNIMSCTCTRQCGINATFPACTNDGGDYKHDSAINADYTTMNVDLHRK